MTDMQFQTENPLSEIFMASENHGFLMLAASGIPNRKWQGLTVGDLNLFADLPWTLAHSDDARFSHSNNGRAWLQASRTANTINRDWQLSCGCKVEERWSWANTNSRLTVTIKLKDQACCSANVKRSEIRLTPLWTLCPAGHSSAGGGHAQLLHDPRNPNRLIVGSTLSSHDVEIEATSGTGARPLQWEAVASPGRMDLLTGADATRGENHTRAVLTTHAVRADVELNRDFRLSIDFVPKLKSKENVDREIGINPHTAPFAELQAQFKDGQWQPAFANCQHSLNQLIRRRADGTLGLQAGLPWFTQFWTRDLCHSFRAAFLWSGRFQDGDELLTALWRSSDQDIPNYTTATSTTNNSADALPLLLLTTADLIDAIGISSGLMDQFPKIIDRLNSAGKTFLAGGLISHGPADTWMDAQKVSPDGKRIACSPRGDRAFEIQAFWLASLTRWLEILKQSVASYSSEHLTAALEAGFATLRNKYFCNEKRLWADHLRPDGFQDLALRPNLMLGLHALQRAKVLHKIMNEMELKKLLDDMISADLVVPYGVRTLSPDTHVKHPLPVNEIFGEESAYIHENKIHFHPYHEFGTRQGLEHPDWAYHNGTIWPWLSQCAIHLLRRTNNHLELSEQLTETLVWHSVHGTQGGAIAELLDGLSSHSRWSWPKGAPHQAWSEAALIQAILEDWLGLQPTGFGYSLRVDTCRWNHIGDFCVTFEMKIGRFQLNKSKKNVTFNISANSTESRQLSIELFNSARPDFVKTISLGHGDSINLALT